MNETAAIITGGGRGLGRTIAEHLSQSYKILIVGRTESDLESSCRHIREKGGTAEYVIGDVKHADTAEQVLSKLNELSWAPSVLVCNAGIGKSSKTHEIDATVWQDIIDTNLNGSFYIAKAILPLFMEQNSGTLCFISSLAGVQGYAYEAAYAASKHGQVGLARSIAKEYGKYDITSVAICPGFIDGEMTERTIHGVMKRRGVTYDEARKRVESKSPRNHILSPDEVATVVESVCSGTMDIPSDNVIILD